MRLSEDRIAAISEKIAKQLAKKRMAGTAKGMRQLAAWIEKPMIEALAREEEIDAEVRRQIDNLQSKPPEGSFEWQALFQKKKEEIARRRNFKM